jgi:hypothetical protein
VAAQAALAPYTILSTEGLTALKTVIDELRVVECGPNFSMAGLRNLSIIGGDLLFFTVRLDPDSATRTLENNT